MKIKNLLIICLLKVLFLSSGQAIEKINDGFYRGKKEEKFYFYMVRLTEKNDSFWREYKKNQKTAFDRHDWISTNLKNAIYNGKVKIANFSGGLAGFDVTQDDPTIQAWIAFISPNKIENSDDISLDDIEMAVTVRTSPDGYPSPMTTHMGIHRAPYYQEKTRKCEQYFTKLEQVNLQNQYDMYKAEMTRDKQDLQDKKIIDNDSQCLYPEHPKVSLDLHSFAAKVMLELFPDKLYMITVPLDEMRLSMKKALPKNTYIGDSLNNFPEKRQDETDQRTPIRREIISGENHIGILDRNRKAILWEADGSKQTVTVGEQVFQGEDWEKYDWFMGSYVAITLFNQPFTTVDIDALASHIKLKPVPSYSEKILTEEKKKRDGHYRKLKELEDKYVKTKEDKQLWDIYAGIHAGSFDKAVENARKNSNFSSSKWVRLILDHSRDNEQQFLYPFIEKMSLEEIKKIEINNREEASRLLTVSIYPDDFDKATYFVENQKADGNYKRFSHDKRTPFLEASKLYDIDAAIKFIKLLYSDGIEINIKDNIQNTPLHYATEVLIKTADKSSSVDLRVMEFLIAKGADVNAINSFKETPLGLVKKKNSRDEIHKQNLEIIAQFLRKNGAT